MRLHTNQLTIRILGTLTGIGFLAVGAYAMVGVLSGILFLGERPTPTEYAAFALVIGSLLTVALPGRK